MAPQHSPKALPRHTAPLAPTVQPLPPGTAKLQAKVPEAAEIARHSVVLVVPTKHAAEIAPLDRHRQVPMLPTPRRYPTNRPPQPLGRGLTEHLKPPLTAHPTDVSEPEEVEGLWLLVPPCCVARRKAPKPNEPGLRLVQPQPKLPQSLSKRLREPCRVVPVLKGKHAIIRVASHIHLAPQLPPHHLLGPQVQRIVQIHVCQDRTNDPTLRSPRLRVEHPTVLDDPRVQPLRDQPQQTPILHPVLEEHSQRALVQFIEERLDVRVEHVAHPPLEDRSFQRGQRVVRAAPRTEPVRTRQEVLLVNRRQYPRHRGLHNLVLDGGNPNRSEPGPLLWHVTPTNRRCHILPGPQSLVQPLQMAPEILLILRRSHSIDPGAAPLLQRCPRRLQRLYRQQVRQRREPQLPIPSRLLGYPLEFRRHGPRLLSAAHVSPQQTLPLSGLSLARVAHLGLPLGPRYCGPIRLLAAHQRALRSPLRPLTRGLLGKRRGLPGCSRTLAHVPMPSTPAALTALALADGRVLPSTTMNVSAAATLEFSGLAHIGPRAPCLRIKMAVARHPARLGSSGAATHSPGGICTHWVRATSFGKLWTALLPSSLHLLVATIVVSFGAVA